MKIVIALGGNMISDAANKTESFEDQKRRIATSAGIIADIIHLGHEVVITHGNGPQVGSLLLQQQADVTGAVQLPLNILGALTQGQIGVLLQHALLNEFTKRNIDKFVTVVPTTVLVDADDPGFTNPTKPVGPFFSEEEFKKLEKDDSHQFIQKPEGYRRVVASPIPRGILEIEQIKLLLDSTMIIAGGGGGSPTARTSEGLELRDAVIDKDRASAVLGNEIGADMLMILTNVDGVYRNFQKEEQVFIPRMTKSEAEQLIASGDVAKGSMQPKVEAGLTFNGHTVITEPEFALQALKGDAGTHIVNN